MKKIIFLLLFLPFYSCNDWLDVESEISVTYRNYFQSESDLEKILVTMLTILCHGVLTTQQFIWQTFYGITSIESRIFLKNV